MTAQLVMRENKMAQKNKQKAKGSIAPNEVVRIRYTVMKKWSNVDMSNEKKGLQMTTPRQ